MKANGLHVFIYGLIELRNPVAAGFYSSFHNRNSLCGSYKVFRSLEQFSVFHRLIVRQAFKVFALPRISADEEGSCDDLYEFALVEYRSARRQALYFPFSLMMIHA